MPLSLLRRCSPVLGFLLLVAGCSPAEEIRTYTVEREAAKPEVPAGPASATGDKSRILGVIIPVTDGSARYVKFFGAIGPVSAAEPAFNEFVASLKLATPDAMPTYKLPTGWAEKAAGQFVAKSFSVGVAGAPAATINDIVSGSLLDNVNRWRGQVGLQPVNQDAMSGLLKEISLGGTKAYRIDLSGPAEPSAGGPMMRGMTPPR